MTANEIEVQSNNIGTLHPEAIPYHLTRAVYEVALQLALTREPRLQAERLVAYREIQELISNWPDKEHPATDHFTCKLLANIINAIRKLEQEANV